MEELLDRIKERVAQRDSPIRTVKGVSEAIGMTESGFYTMLKRGTTKMGTLHAIANALKTDVSYLTNDYNKSSNTDRGHDGEWQNLALEMKEMKRMFEEQLVAKDAIIAGLVKTVDALVGKSEGATFGPLSSEVLEFQTRLRDYMQAVYQQPFMQSIFLR